MQKEKDKAQEERDKAQEDRDKVREKAEEMRCEFEKKLQSAVEDKEYIQQSYETFMEEYQRMRVCYSFLFTVCT